MEQVKQADKVFYKLFPDTYVIGKRVEDHDEVIYECRSDRIYFEVKILTNSLSTVGDNL